jgi:hypothetical protein
MMYQIRCKQVASLFTGVSLVLGSLAGCASPPSSSNPIPPSNTSAQVSSSVLSQELEPSYCQPTSFDETEFSLGAFEKMRKVGLVRAHGFKLGQVTVIGAGVGNSNPSALIQLAEKFSPGSQDQKYCTWYFNHPKGGEAQDVTRIQAAKIFNHRDVPKSPVNLSSSAAEKEFMNALEKTFSQEKTSFLSCAENQKYIAMGCNEMMHRGPTVFGMLLAYSGCSPEHSLEITNQIWGLNGVRRKVRLAVIRKAYELGSEQFESRKRLAELFSETK